MQRPLRASLVAWALMPACSVVFDLGGSDDVTGTIGGGVDVRAPGGDADEAPPVESCNGLDDDGDGAIDEGFTDYDGDGIPDCDGPVCPPLERGEAGPVPVVDACSSMPDGPVAGAWVASVSWGWSIAAGELGAGTGLAAPVTGNLDDDTLDGVIDDRDTPDLVVQTAAFDPMCNCSLPGLTVALDGRTGAEKWRASGSGDGGGALIADLDDDGHPDVLTIGSDGSLLALEGDGRPKWSARGTRTVLRVRPPVVADLAGDGRAEVVLGNLVLDAVDGTGKFALDEPFPYSAGTAAIADLDLDGVQEILYQGGVYSSEGRLLWKADIEGGPGMWPVIVQADEDAQAEVVWIGRAFTVWGHDGAAIAAPTTYIGDSPGAPCGGDLDDDGQMEIAWLDGTKLYAYDLDGSEKWQSALTGAELAGCSTFDLDGDRAAEVLLLDDDGLRVIDGRSGQVRLTRATGYAPTEGSYPVVADVDLDGHAEVVTTGVGAGGESVLEVFEHDGSGWAPSGGSWPSYDYAVGNLLSDGHIPRRPGAWWTQYASFRGRPAGDFVSRPDLTVAITDVCVADCTLGPVRVAVQVANQGGREQYAGGRLVLYTLDGAVRREVASTTLPSIAAGYALDGYEFEVSPYDMGSGGWIARIEDDGTDADYLGDCDPDNQQDERTDVECAPGTR